MCLFIFDLCIGEKPSAGQMDLMHLMYDVVLKILLAVMLIQRRPIEEPRRYEIDIHEKYKPFDETLYSGCDATRTVSKLRTLVREKTIELTEKKAKQKQSDIVKFNLLPPAPNLPEKHLQTRTIPLQAAPLLHEVETAENQPQIVEQGSCMDARVEPPRDVVNKSGDAENERTKDSPVTNTKSGGANERAKEE